MALVASIAEKIKQLAGKRARWTADGQTAWLYVNDHDPTPYDDLTDYNPTSVEGVSGQPTSWPYPPQDNGDGTAILRGGYLAYTPTGTGVVETIVGIFFVDDSTGAFAFAERFEFPVVDFGATLEPVIVPLLYADDDVP